MKSLPAFFFLLFFVGCTMSRMPDNEDIGGLAQDYIKLGLVIGQYDTDFVDAYYGPDSLKPAGVSGKVFPKDSLLSAVNNLEAKLSKIASSKDTGVSKRAEWISAQLTAFRFRIKIFSGEASAFDIEAKELFGVTPPQHDEQYFKDIISSMDKTLPGIGTIDERFKKLSERFIIPADKVDTIFRTAIAEARRRTLAHYRLPANENFTLAYVKDKPWSGYNWYKGNFQSEIQINTDLPIYIERAIDLACHEGYPGHHVYNMLLEKNLYHDQGFTEICLYPLFSPQSLIAEGSANYGIELAFPGNEQRDYCKNVLLPLAGLDTVGLDAYFFANQLKSRLSYAKNEAARGLLDGKFSEAEALKWLEAYALYSRKGAENYVKFIKSYRSYVINYNYGLDLVTYYIHSRAGNDQEKKWKAFGELLSNQVLTTSLK